MEAPRIETFNAADGTLVHFRRWSTAQPARSVVQIVHGAAEHSGRYDRFARELVSHGYVVYASDHRGHGLTRVRSGALGDAGPDGWNAIVEDEIALARRIKATHPEVSHVLFGHSLGSFIAQDFAEREGALLDALVLSGTTYGPPPPQTFLDAAQAAAEADPLGGSQLWSGRFKSYNAPFAGETGFEWLSRDAEEVRKYVDDPLTGFPFTNEFVRDIFAGLARIRNPALQSRIPRDLPVLVIQGELDPVGENLKGTQALLERYHAVGLTRVQHRFYAGARHELLNETNREEVTRDVIDWLRGVGG
jgi:alpha-beta hydrolase superfamily lysophospholipase